MMNEITPVGFVYLNDDNAYYPSGTGVELDPSDVPRYDQSAIDTLQARIAKLEAALRETLELCEDYGVDSPYCAVDKAREALGIKP